MHGRYSTEPMRIAPMLFASLVMRDIDLNRNQSQINDNLIGSQNHFYISRVNAISLKHLLFGWMWSR